MKHTFSVVGFLREARLAEIIGALAPTAFAAQFKLEGRQFRWDIKYETDRGRYLVEYDGDEHYRNTVVIRNDEEKDRIAKANGYTSIRFPYWLQLDTFTLSHFFGLEAHIEQTFPHGFITTKIFPASFCEMGLQRFQREYIALPHHLRQAVLASLERRASEYGSEYVLPTSFSRLWRNAPQPSLPGDVPASGPSPFQPGRA